MNITQSFIHDGSKYRAFVVENANPENSSVLAKVEDTSDYIYIDSKGVTSLLPCLESRKTTSSGNVYYVVANLPNDLTIVREYERYSPELGKWKFVSTEDLEWWEESYFHALEVPTYGNFKHMHKCIKAFGYDSFADFKQLCRDLNKNKNVKLHCCVYKLTTVIDLRISLHSLDARHLGYSTIDKLREAWNTATKGIVKVENGIIRLYASYNDSHYLRK